MLDLNHPHDAFCKSFFNHPAVAAELFAAHLPEASAFDLTRLELVKDSFIDPELQEHFSDLLLRAPLRQGGLAYACLLIEHKSAPYKLVSFQALGYQVRFWEQCLREGAKKLPPIVPFVMYLMRRRWRYERRFSALLDWGGHEELRRYVPEFEYYLFDLHDYDERNAAESAWLRAGLGLLKYVFQKKQLKTRLPELLRWLNQAPQASEFNYIWTAMNYLASGSELQPGDLQEALAEAFPKEGDFMPSMARQWFDEGRQEGQREGRQEGQREGTTVTTIRLLRRRVGILGEELEMQIRALPPAALEELGEALLDFSTHDDLTAWLGARQKQP